MLGRRDPQRSLFEAQAWPHRVPDDSFYARMGTVNDVLFPDDDLAGAYCADNGRPSLPPSLLSGITLLQFYDDVSDQEAIARLNFDLRWKVALNLPLDFTPPHPSSLSVFRKRLVDHGQERYAFNRLVQVGRAAGFLPEKITVLVDTLSQHGAGAVQDTYTLIRKGIRRVLKLAGYQVPLKRRGLAANLAAYLDSDHKAEIDWADPAARAAQLKVLAQDAEAVLALALEQVADPEVRAAAWLLTKILGDDLTLDEAGEPQIAEGTAPDRIVSLTDLEMRHGRTHRPTLAAGQGHGQSAAQRFDGRKWQVAEEPGSELLVAVEPVPANVGDGRDLLAVIEHVEGQAHVTVERVIADGAYGTADNRAACVSARDSIWFRPWPCLTIRKSPRPPLRSTWSPTPSPARTVTPRVSTPWRRTSSAGQSRPLSLSEKPVKPARCSHAVSIAKLRAGRLRCIITKPCSKPLVSDKPRMSSKRSTGSGPPSNARSRSRVSTGRNRPAIWANSKTGCKPSGRGP